MKKIKNIIFVIIISIITFLMSQIIVYFLSKENFLKSPMYILLPLVGFFGMYFFTNHFIEFVKIKKLYFFIIFVLMGLFIYYFILVLYFYQIYVVLNGLSISMALKIDYFGLLLDSAFIEFLFSGAVGIIFAKK